MAQSKRKAESAPVVNGSSKSKKLKTTKAPISDSGKKHKKLKTTKAATIDGGSKHNKTKKATAPDHKRIKKPIAAKKAKDPESDSESDSSDDASWDGFDTEKLATLTLSDDEPTSMSDDPEATSSLVDRGPEPHPDRKANTTSSREAHAKQKALVQERKAAKPNADIMLRSKKLWERLRRKSHVPKVERRALVAELFDILKGRVKDFVLKHDAVRVVQTGVKYANDERRLMIARELKGEYRHLAESRYAKFLIGKLLVKGNEEIRDIVVPEFYGHVRRMIRHPEASWILDDVYRGVATHKQKAILLREWYGAEFALFKTTDPTDITSDLKGILKASPEKRTPIMRSLHELLNQLIQKKLTGFTMLHDAMLQYFLNVQPGGEEMTDFLELIKGDEEGDLLKNLAFTKSGARLVCLALAYGTAKDRKIILRNYKDVISALAYDTHGHLVLLAAYDVIDDTVLTTKSIFPELLGKPEASQDENIKNAITNLNARIPFLYLSAGRARWLLSEGDVKVLQEIDAIRKTTSKKEPNVRRLELLKNLMPPLLQLVEREVELLCQNSFGCQFVTEVFLSAEGDKSAVLERIADQAKGDPKAADHLSQRAGGGPMLKTLVLGGKFNAKTQKVERVQPPLDFPEMLYPRISKHLVAWATSSSSFIVLGLLEAEGFSLREEALEKLKKHRDVIEGVAFTETPEQEARRKHKGKEASEDQAVDRLKPLPHGNSGAKMILKLLD